MRKRTESVLDMRSLIGQPRDTRSREQSGNRRNRSSRAYRRGSALAAEGRFRPSIPPVATCATVAWISCAALYAFGYSLPAATCALGAVLCALCTCAAGAVMCMLPAPLHATAVVVGVLSGCTLGMFGAYDMHRALDEAESLKQGTYEALAQDDAVRNDFGWSCSARVTLAEEHAVLMRVYGSSDELPRYGDMIVFEATPKRPSEVACWSRWMHGQCADVSLRSFEQTETKGLYGMLVQTRSTAIDIMHSCGSSSASIAVLAALVCGYRTDLYELDDYDNFALSGIAHIVAVSGSHMSLVVSLAVSVLRRCRMGMRATVAAALACMLGYLVLAGAPSSAVRSVIMATCALVSPLFKRRSASLNALGVCALALLAFDPPLSVSVSFTLSAASTAGIILLAPLFRQWCASVPKLPEIVSDSVALTLSSSVTTIPLSAAFFSQISLVSPVTNIFVAPLFLLAYIGGLVGVAMTVAVAPLGTFVLQGACACADGMRLLACACARLPYAALPAALSVPVAVGTLIGATLLLWAWWPTMRLRTFVVSIATMACLVFFMHLAAPWYIRDAVIALDVGQGDSFLIRSGRETMLIDTGNQDAMLKAALARHGVTHIDALVITHADDDHCGSLDALRGIARVDAIYLARDALSCPCDNCTRLVTEAKRTAKRVEGLSVGDHIRMSTFDFEVLWPDAFEDEGGNADSLCLYMDYATTSDDDARWSALWCGDAETEQIRTLLERGAVADIDILKVGHHGSKAALDQKCIEALDPEIALIGVGAGNRYGHPADEVTQGLASIGCEVYRTDESGDIVCALSTRGIEVRTLG